MAINQPPITGNTVLDAWMLEVTRELNGGTGVATATSSTVVTGSGSSPIQRVDTTVTDNILRLAGGTLSNLPNVTSIKVGNGPMQTGDVQLSDTGGGGFTSVDLDQTDYSITIPDPGGTAVPQTSYQFTLVGSSIPDTHMLFLGGLRLCESTSSTTRDYTISGNTITLTRASRDFIGLDLILTVFTATLS